MGTISESDAIYIQRLRAKWAREEPKPVLSRKDRMIARARKIIKEANGRQNRNAEQ